MALLSAEKQRVAGARARQTAATAQCQSTGVPGGRSVVSETVRCHCRRRCSCRTVAATLPLPGTLCLECLEAKKAGFLLDLLLRGALASAVQSTNLRLTPAAVL